MRYNAVSRPEVRRRMAAAGADPVTLSPAVFAAFVQSEREKWGRVVREARITLGQLGPCGGGRGAPGASCPRGWYPPRARA